MIVKLLTERHLEFLNLKRGCRGSSESRLSKCQFVGSPMSRLSFDLSFISDDYKLLPKYQEIMRLILQFNIFLKNSEQKNTKIYYLHFIYSTLLTFCIAVFMAFFNVITLLYIV